MANQKTIAISASGDNWIHNLSTTTRTGVLGYTLFSTSNLVAILKDEAGTEFGRYQFMAPGQVVIPDIMERFTAKGGIIVNLSASAVVTGHFTYVGKDG